MTTVSQVRRDARLVVLGIAIVLHSTRTDPITLGPAFGLLLTLLALIFAPASGWAIVALVLSIFFVVARYASPAQWLGFVGKRITPRPIQNLTRGAAHSLALGGMAIGFYSLRNTSLIGVGFLLLGVLSLVVLILWQGLCVVAAMKLRSGAAYCLAIVALSTAVLMANPLRAFAHDGGWQECQDPGKNWFTNMGNYLSLQCPGSDEPVMASGPNPVLVGGVILICIGALIPPPPLDLALPSSDVPEVWSMDPWDYEPYPEEDPVDPPPAPPDPPVEEVTIPPPPPPPPEGPKKGDYKKERTSAQERRRAMFDEKRRERQRRRAMFERAKARVRGPKGGRNRRTR